MLGHLQKTIRQQHNPVPSVRPSLKIPRLAFIKYHTTTMSSSEEPTADKAKVLLERLEHKFPSKTLGTDRWYLVAVRLALTSSEPLA